MQELNPTGVVFWFGLGELPKGRGGVGQTDCLIGKGSRRCGEAGGGGRRRMRDMMTIGLVKSNIKHL